MRVSYNEQIDGLSADLASICGLAETAMEASTTALLTADIALAERTIDSRDEIDVMAQGWEHKAFALLATQSPVATDLRRVVSGIHVIADLQRMGGLAIHVAQLARLRHPAHVLPPEVEPVFRQMGKVATAQAAAAREVLISQDADLAVELQMQDADMDELHRSLFVLTAASDWPYGVPAAVDVTLLGRFYERFSDHTAAVARRVIFLVTGELRD